MANGNNESSMNHIIFHCDINFNYDDNDDDDSTYNDTITWACAEAAPSVVSPWRSCTFSHKQQSTRLTTTDAFDGDDGDVHPAHGTERRGDSAALTMRRDLHNGLQLESYYFGMLSLTVTMSQFCFSWGYCLRLHVVRYNLGMLAVFRGDVQEAYQVYPRGFRHGKKMPDESRDPPRAVGFTLA